MPLRYGRTPDDYSKPKLDMTELVTTADFSIVPPAADYGAGLKWRMLGNGPDPEVGPSFEGAGDCEAARWANHRYLMNAGYPTMDQVWQLYKTQNPDFDPVGDPNTDGPGSSADGGMSTDVLLDYLHKNGGPDGVKVLAYGTIDPTNEQAVERAIGIFGAVWVDILVQPGNQTEFARGAEWTDTGEPPEGAHAVLSPGYVPERRFITWADETTFAETFWHGSTQEGPLVERVYLPIWPEHATHAFISSVGAQQLAELYQALTGKTLTWPTPAPPPPTPSQGTSYLVTSPDAVARIAQAARHKDLSPDAWVTRHFDHYFRLADMVVSGD